MKHWIQNLPEGKRIFSSELDKLESLRNRQTELFDQIYELSKEVFYQEMLIEMEATRHYSKQEIVEAKKIGPILPSL